MHCKVYDMTCSQLVERLFSYAAFAKIKKNVLCMDQIDTWQNHLHRRFSSIHIAGTNGKGSVALKIAAALQKSGRKVGLYTSPHISTYRERIQVNGQHISEDFVAQYLPKLFSFIDKQKMRPTFFELLTALAFEYFAFEKIDVAVLEVGLGGKLDATNVVTPIISVITSIAYDHIDQLGPTLDDIARAKAAIIKEGIPAVVGPRACCAPILSAAGKNLISVPKVEGYFDDENSAIARATLEYLKIPQQAILEALKVRPSCRFEIIQPRPVILDVAHNVDGFSHLRQALDLYYPGIKFRVGLAMGKEKDPAECIRELGDAVEAIDCLSNGHPRLASSDRLLQRLQEKGFQNVHLATSIREILQKNNPTLICGSFFIMNDARLALGIEGPYDLSAFSPIRLSQNNDGAASRLIHR